MEEQNQQLSAQSPQPQEGEEEVVIKEENVEEGVVKEEKEKDEEDKEKEEQIYQQQLAELIKRYKDTYDRANQLKNEGNEYVKKEDYIGAIQKYSEALQDCRPFYLMSCPEELLKDYIQLSNNLLNNISYAYLNIHEYELCINMAKEVLKTDEENVKALFRISMAYELQGKLQLAFEFIQNAYNIQKNFGQIEKSIMEKYQQIRYKLNKSQSAQNKDQQLFYQRMFNQEILDDAPKAESKLLSEISPLISQVVVSGTAATILASAVTHYILEESLSSQKGMMQSMLVGGSIFSAILLKKNWHKMTFGALSAGTIFVLLYQKRQLTQ